MATPMTADQMVAALKAEGLKVVEIPGWRTNNREGRGPWGPVNGVVNHHIGSDVSDPAGYAASILFNGYSTLPGPLCQAGGGVDGTIYLTGNGRCNHAGGGDPASLAAVVNNTTPMDSELRPQFGNSNGVDGNSHFYGIEVMYSGGHPMSAAQYDALVRWNTAICRFHGWDGRSVIGHREWSSDKPDPGQARMTDIRRDVNARLNGSTPPAPEGDTVTPQDIQAIADAILNTPVTRQGGQTGDTTLRAVVAWFDSNVKGIPDATLNRELPVIDGATGKPGTRKTSLGTEASWAAANFSKPRP